MKVFKIKTDQKSTSLSQSAEHITLTNPSDIKAGLEPDSEYVCTITPVPEGYKFGDKNPRDMPDGECAFFSEERWTFGGKSADLRSDDSLYVYKIQPNPQDRLSIKLDGKDITLTAEQAELIINGIKEPE